MHMRHRFVLVNWEQVVVRNSREEEKPWQPFAVCDSSSQDFSRTWYFTSKWRGSHLLSHENCLWENLDCLRYIESKVWFCGLLGVTPSPAASVEAVARGWTAVAGKATAGVGELPTGTACPVLLLVPLLVLLLVPLLVLVLPLPLSCSWCWCRSPRVLSVYPLASARQVVQLIPCGNCCFIIWQCCRLLVCALFLFHYLLFCLGCFCFDTLMPEDSVGGKADVESW